jgi:hypothetical protein
MPMAATPWMRLRRRYKQHIKHTDTPIHPVAIYAIVAVMIIATIGLVAYTLTAVA